MYFDLSEAKDVKGADTFLQDFEEIMSFLKGKGADAKVANYGLEQIAFKNNKFHFTLNVSIPLRK